jgi:cupin fold WbuC family metalloprotein
MLKHNKPAMPNVGGKVFLLNEKILADGIRLSRKSRRKRIILPVHRTQQAKVNRMINFMQPGTYVRPHKHPESHASETVVVLSGSIRFLIFDEIGFIEDDILLTSDPGKSVVDIEPDVWHSFIVIQEDSVIYEAKKGPYNPQKDKEFAGWSPEEYTEEAISWVAALEKSND